MPATMNRLVKHLDNMLADGPLDSQDYHFMICQCLETTEWKIRKDTDRDYWIMSALTSMRYDRVYRNKPESALAMARNRITLAHAAISIESLTASVAAWGQKS